MAKSLTLQHGILNQTTHEHLQTSLDLMTTGDLEDGGVVSIATSETSHTIAVGGGDPGWAIFKNEDDTNFVQLGFATGRTDILIPAGLWAGPIHLDASVTQFFAIADTAAVLLRFKIFEA